MRNLDEKSLNVSSHLQRLEAAFCGFRAQALTAQAVQIHSDSGRSGLLKPNRHTWLAGRFTADSLVLLVFGALKEGSFGLKKSSCVI